MVQRHGPRQRMDRALAGHIGRDALLAGVPLRRGQVDNGAATALFHLGDGIAPGQHDAADIDFHALLERLPRGVQRRAIGMHRRRVHHDVETAEQIHRLGHRRLDRFGIGDIGAIGGDRQPLRDGERGQFLIGGAVDAGGQHRRPALRQPQRGRAANAGGAGDKGDLARKILIRHQGWFPFCRGDCGHAGDPKASRGKVKPKTRCLMDSAAGLAIVAPQGRRTRCSR